MWILNICVFPHPYSLLPNERNSIPPPPPPPPFVKGEFELCGSKVDSAFILLSLMK